MSKTKAKPKKGVGQGTGSKGGTVGNQVQKKKAAKPYKSKGTKK